MAQPTHNRARLNIYLDDARLRRRVKIAAARQDLSVSEYCLRAIKSQLAREGIEEEEKKKPSTPGPVARARKFQQETFKGRVFTISSADLIHQARAERNRRS